MAVGAKASQLVELRVNTVGNHFPFPETVWSVRIDYAPYPAFNVADVGHGVGYCMKSAAIRF